MIGADGVVLGLADFGNGKGKRDRAGQQFGEIVVGLDPRDYLWFGVGSIGYAPGADALARVMLSEDVLASMCSLITIRPKRASIAAIQAPGLGTILPMSARKATPKSARKGMGELKVLTRDEVVWGYRYILGRHPENDAVVNAAAAAIKDVPTFREILLKSKEFSRLVVRC